ncbi:beta strand repeat-containing protein [Cohnella sp. GCM10012308]|uniref:beta strand repeat-containing protein n=1 Tax=Cohnella sp. GCM10012308 TaxID=3317329 RepID=UPI003621D2CC
MSNILGLVRKDGNNGVFSSYASSLDTNNNSTDFVARTPIPRNSSTSQLPYVPPMYTISSLSDVTPTELNAGYAPETQETKTVTVTRTGTGDLTSLTTALSGTNASSFTVTQPLLTTLNSVTPSTTFAVKANDGLVAGTYTATVTVTADNMTPVTFAVTQVVNVPPADTTPPVVTGVTEAGLYNTNKTISFNEGTATLNGSAFTSGSTVSAEGFYTLIVTDAADNMTTVHFTIDKTAPTVTGAANGSSYNNDRTLTLSDGTATLNGSAFTSGSTVSTEGSYTLVATDAAGNTRTVTFIIDKTAPLVLGVTDTGLYNTSKTITFNEGTATLNGSAFTSGSMVSAEGSYTLIVTDTAGNTTTVNFTIDKTGPVVTGVSDSGLYNVDQTITFNKGTATLDGSPFTSGSTVSAEGPHTLIVTDTAGNTTTVNFTIDKTAPVVMGVADSGQYNVNKTITFNEGTATLDGSPFTSGSTVSAEGPHTLVVTDGAGNTSTIHFTIDKTAPIVTGVTEGLLYNISQTITFNEGTAALDGSPFTSGSTVSAEGPHTLIVTDTAGNTTTVTFSIDKTAPVVMGVADSGQYNVNKTITFDEGSATLDGSPFTSGSTVSAEDSHTLIVTDAAGNTTTVSFTIDKTAPVITGAADAGEYSSDLTIAFNEGTATLDGAGFSSGGIVDGEGSHTLIVADAAGNSTTIQFNLDKTAPIGTLVINGNADSTANKTVTLTVTGSDGGGAGGIQARFSNDNTDWTEWQAIAASQAWTLTSGKGTKTVYMQLKDSLGNVSSSYTDTIAYKSVPQLADYKHSGMDNQAVSLSASFFGYSNEDGSTLQKIKIVSLPDHGTLMFNNVAAAVSQEIDIAHIDQLVYTPQLGWSGTAKLVWNAYDGELYADCNAAVSFVLQASPNPNPTTPVDSNSAQLIVNGVVQKQMATVKTETLPDGRKRSTIKLDDQAMNAKLETEGNHAIIIIPFTKDEDQAFSMLNGLMAKNMAAHEAVLQVQTNNASYTIPARLIDIDTVFAMFDSNAALKDF